MKGRSIFSVLAFLLSICLTACLGLSGCATSFLKQPQDLAWSYVPASPMASVKVKYAHHGFDIHVVAQSYVSEGNKNSAKTYFERLQTSVKSAGLEQLSRQIGNSGSPGQEYELEITPNHGEFFILGGLPDVNNAAYLQFSAYLRGPLPSQAKVWGSQFAVGGMSRQDGAELATIFAQKVISGLKGEKWIPN